MFGLVSWSLCRATHVERGDGEGGARKVRGAKWVGSRLGQHGMVKAMDSADGDVDGISGFSTPA